MADFTLADLMLQWTHDPWKYFKLGPLANKMKRAAEPNIIAMRQHLKQARRICLDSDFLRQVIIAASAQPNEIIARCDLANLPFDTTWLEFDQHERVRIQHELGTSGPPQIDKISRRIGYLFRRRHPDIATSWRVEEVTGDDDPESVGMAAHDLVFNPTMAEFELFVKERIPVEGTDPANLAMDLLALCWGYTVKDDKSMKVLPHRDLMTRALPCINNTLYKPVMLMAHTQDRRVKFEKSFAQSVYEGRGDIRFLVTALAMINYVPIRKVHVPRSGMYRKRLRNFQYLDYQTITIEAGRKRTERVVADALSFHEGLVRRRAHEVRGHWRHYLATPRCAAYHEHVWEAMPSQRDECQRCGSMRRWIDRHTRGDATLGFVTHDYEVVEG